MITGRALDIGLFMALPMLRGHARPRSPRTPGKLLECGGLALEPGDSGRAIWASLDDVRLRGALPVTTVAAPSVRSLVSHTFYERVAPDARGEPGRHPRPRAATYEELETDGRVAVRCEGAQLASRRRTRC